MSRIRKPDVFDSDPMYVGETRKRCVIAALGTGETIAPDTAKWQVFDADTGLAKTEKAAATVDGGKVYAYIPAGAVPGRRYVVFTYHIGSETLVAKVNFEVKALTE